MEINNVIKNEAACRTNVVNLLIQKISRHCKAVVLCMTLLCGVLLTACGQDEELAAYQEDMNTFFEHIIAVNDGMNMIDASAEDAASRLLTYLDQLEEEFVWMAELTVPDEFSAVDSLADEAEENMREAVSLYHRAYESGEFDEPVAEAAREYYDRANIRIQYIITILHGEIPEGEGITYTEENTILGGGYLNKSEEDGTEEPESGESEANEDAGADGNDSDDFDTDDTVFYEE